MPHWVPSQPRVRPIASTARKLRSGHGTALILTPLQRDTSSRAPTRLNWSAGTRRRQPLACSAGNRQPAPLGDAYRALRFRECTTTLLLQHEDVDRALAAEAESDWIEILYREGRRLLAGQDAAGRLTGERHEHCPVQHLFPIDDNL